MTVQIDDEVPTKLLSRREVIEDIHPTLHRLREKGPVVLSSEGAFVTGHALCDELLLDPRLVKHVSYAPPPGGRRPAILRRC